MKWSAQPLHQLQHSLSKEAKKRNGLIFDYSQIQNNQNWHSVISIHLETKCAHICASTTYFIPVLWIHNALSSWNLSLSLSLVFLSSFEASVLRHLWGTFLGMFFFFFNWFGEKCVYGPEFICDIAPNYLRAPSGHREAQKGRWHKHSL